ncbi:serine/threonine protein kinase [Aeoliella mucimassa]|uniref:Serine/threonine-protein kinase StkP n=1 Tax=Aeoliella mucimassa TaxID=2527972 RepID=A0A518ALN0_9BACT|nr:serine/threonine-protein kinase [Aeoliella mucimassa]QDU55637.1 Serine/threonine-protein kinase StkP [Aeoliella mucimassa]
MSTFQEVIGEYKVVKELGSGASGAAYQAEHLESGEQVAIKVMHDRLASDPNIQNRFVREVSVLQKLDHPNIVRHIDCGLDDGRLYLVMEWVDYGTLDTVLRRRQQIGWRETVECVLQICAGLQHAHERGIIHRDLKPANLFLSTAGHVKVGDFGLARDAELHRLTMEGNTVGSCRYMAPEQIRGADKLTSACDLYAVGCLMYRMLEGRVPFDGETIIQVFENHLYKEIPKLSPNSDRPAALDTLVERLLAKHPADRPGKADEVAEALQAILDGNPVRTEFTAVTPEPQAEGDPPATADNSGPPNLTERLMSGEPGGEVRQANWGLLLAIVGAIGLIALIAWLANR